MFVKPNDLGGTLVFNHNEDDDIGIDGDDDGDSGQDASDEDEVGLQGTVESQILEVPNI